MISLRYVHTLLQNVSYEEQETGTQVNSQRPSSTVPVDIGNFSAALCDSHFLEQRPKRPRKTHDE